MTVAAREPLDELVLRTRLIAAQFEVCDELESIVCG